VLLQGTGQITYAIPSGDGFVTDAKVIGSFKTQLMKTSRYEITGGSATPHDALNHLQSCRASAVMHSIA
jgi:hypothetical protein